MTETNEDYKDLAEILVWNEYIQDALPGAGPYDHVWKEDGTMTPLAQQRYEELLGIIEAWLPDPRSEKTHE